VSTTRSAERDERTVAVENVSYRLAFFVLSTAVFYDGAYRSIVLHQAVWDLLALVFVSFGVATIYQARQKTLTRGWAKKVLRIACVWAVIGGIMGAILAAIQPFLR